MHISCFIIQRKFQRFVPFSTFTSIWYINYSKQTVYTNFLSVKLVLLLGLRIFGFVQTRIFAEFYTVLHERDFIWRCVQRLLDTALPTLLLGGGGYQATTAARLWAYLTSLAVGRPLALDGEVPLHAHFHSYLHGSAGYSLDIEPRDLRRDANTRERIDELKLFIEKRLSRFHWWSLQRLWSIVIFICDVHFIFFHSTHSSRSN